MVLTAVTAAADKPFSKIVTFGDSLSDTGNAFLYTGGFYPANDLFTTLTFGGNIGLTIHHAVQNTAQSVAALASHGARHILVANLPDLGLTALGRSLGPVGSAQLSYLTDVYNAGLDQALDSLDAAGIPTILLDAAGLIREIAANPEKFGLVNATEAALDSGNDADDYLFWKARRTDRYLRAVETIQRHGITVNGCFILGLDGDGPDSFEHVFRFVEESGVYDVQITYLTPFPGTPLWKRLTEEGRLLSAEATERCTLFDINFRPTDMSVEEISIGW